MVDNKICFITCVNNERVYEESLIYIKNLNIPEGFVVEYRALRNQKSITSAYNFAMKDCDAKYKVYLHQDVFIINKNFIFDILEVFNNENIGMIGVAGSKAIPTNGVWWESNKTYGKVYDSHTGKISLLQFSEVVEKYETVKAIDGLIMITQYDIPWRENIFDGWHFYDISQSIEFIKAGYEVVIPKQKEPWCIHDCGIVNVRNGYDYYREKFLKEYSKDIFPLVSILIPTYNQVNYLKKALESALNQTYYNIEIIIGDDSTNNDVKDFIKPYIDKYNNIRYFRNQRTEMDYGISNGINLFKESRGEYINYLFHDDIIHQDKINYMMNYFIERDDISLITSHRQLIDANGNMLNDNHATQRLFSEDKIIDGKELMLFCLDNFTNFIGEPTSILFKKSSLKEGFGFFNGNHYTTNIDLATCFSALQNGKGVYVSKSLSYFRQHSKQNSNNLEIQAKGVIEWRKLVEDSYQTGLISSKEEYLKLLAKWIRSFSYIFQLILNQNCSASLKAQLEETFSNTIKTLLD
ncbi:Chondroitin polymerase [Clostridium sp. N3C]|uniref:glycosyltransferase n=1 Tax=Clostridium sp. N3C TaxID=1776758 RepID=UPI00092DF67E|nr:glycosyltransferase [Clostridium sp. N3C]SCN21294.1 Chondroitin polymerase [Clostridium sp. N3C]